jgi:hypothetical protein
LSLLLAKVGKIVPALLLLMLFVHILVYLLRQGQSHVHLSCVMVNDGGGRRLGFSDVDCCKASGGSSLETVCFLYRNAR